MFELTNEQRKCFALLPVSDTWKRIQLQASRYDHFDTIVYVSGDTIVKCVVSGEIQYYEYDVNEKITEDGEYLLPKTSKGKPVRLTSSTFLKRNGIGMRLNYYGEYIDLYNCISDCSYYSNGHVDDAITNITDFSEWVRKWCEETTQEDILDIQNFADQQRKHVRFKEGDVFRFKLSRRLYGYGRVLLDYDKMRKAKEPFWDVLMTKPIVCSVYHIATERKDVSIDELRQLQALPSQIISDNNLYYGEYEIIGNIPVGPLEDYPIMYGYSIRYGENALCYQCGKTYRRIEGGTALYNGFRNNGVSIRLHASLKTLRECIEAGSNMPYWDRCNSYCHDLRHPKFEKELAEVREQFQLE